MKIAVVGTGYVGLVTGVSLSQIGHEVICIDNDINKLEIMASGKSPIYEPGLDELLESNIKKGRLKFTNNHAEAFEKVNIIYIAVGTPEKEDGTANLNYINDVTDQIAQNIIKDTIVVIKSTVPVGTNDQIQRNLRLKVAPKYKVSVVSNPEFLREGSAVYDIFNGDRIIIGSESKEALSIIREINQPFGIPIFETNTRSAEMIKYASNAFLATKISFINEIANICEKVEANIDEVAFGMGMDTRVGNQFLKAGIGYGGSCFPKDTKALKKIAENVDYDFNLLSAVIEFNNTQQHKLLSEALKDFKTLKGKTVAILGLSFKPGTDDVREAASLVVIPRLLEMGAIVKAFDPVAVENIKRYLPTEVEYFNNLHDVIDNADIAFILTEWEEITSVGLELFEKRMKHPNIYDGRNCYELNQVERRNINYYSIGRKKIENYNLANVF